MAVFARVDGGMIVEFYEPPPGVPITDCFHNSFVWANVTNFMPMPEVGWIATPVNGGYIFEAPQAPPLTLQAKAQEMLGNGISIVCVGTPEVSGTYSVMPDAQNRIAATAIYCQINNRFPRSSSTLAWVDLYGQPHLFTSLQSFLEFATASADFVDALDQVMLGASQTLPTLPVTIA